MNPLLLEGLAQGVGGLISGITGLFQRHKGNELLAQNPYPTYNIPQEQFSNQRMASVNASNGMPAAQYQQAMQNIQRQQAQAIAGAQSRRGGLATIAQTQKNADDAQLGLDSANAQQRLKNQQVLYGINNQVSGYKDKAFDWNQKQKYLQNYSRAMSLLGAGGQNLTSGFEGLASGGLMAAGGAGLFGRGGQFASNYSGSYNPYSQYGVPDTTIY